MSYNDNDTYGSSGRQGASGGYGDDRSDRLDRDTGLGGDSYGSGGRTGGTGDDSYSSGGALGSDSYGVSSMADLSGTTSGAGYGNKTSSFSDNRGLADKARDKLSSDRTDRPDDPISGTNYDQSSTGRDTGYGDNSSSSYGNDNRGLAEKARDKLSSDRTDRPDDPISGTNYDQSSSGRNTNYGDSTSRNTGLGDSSSTGYGTSGTTGSGYGDTSSNSYGGSGQDNRSYSEKAKDLISSKRSDQPDDPVSGQNYGEDNSRDSYGSSGNNNNNNKPSLMDKVKDKVGLNKDKNDNSYGSDSHGSSGRSDNY